MSYLHALDPPKTEGQMGTHPPPVDVVSLEFEQHWDTTSDLNEDDLDYMREETLHWWGNANEPPSCIDASAMQAPAPVS